jgi:hypothetical protein
MMEAELGREVVDQAVQIEQLRPFRTQWEALLPRVRMMMDVHGTTFYVRGKVDP